jgi:cytochrome c-type biogenesis protein CcmH
MVVLLLCVAAPFVARAIDPASLDDPVQQQRYEDLIHELRCLQCTGETIADTPAQFAVDIRRQVREMIQSGSTDAEVRQYLVERYGDLAVVVARVAAGARGIRGRAYRAPAPGAARHRHQRAR